MQDAKRDGTPPEKMQLMALQRQLREREVQLQREEQHLQSKKADIQVCAFKQHHLHAHAYSMDETAGLMSLSRLGRPEAGAFPS